MDYLRFALMLDGQSILSRETVEMMTTDQLGDEVRARSTSPLLAAGYSFGLGFTVRTPRRPRPLDIKMPSLADALGLRRALQDGMAAAAQPGSVAVPAVEQRRDEIVHST